jgi:hypothetical protein
MGILRGIFSGLIKRPLCAGGCINVHPISKGEIGDPAHWENMRKTCRNLYSEAQMRLIRCRISGHDAGGEAALPDGEAVLSYRSFAQ